MAQIPGEAGWLGRFRKGIRGAVDRWLGRVNQEIQTQWTTNPYVVPSVDLLPTVEDFTRDLNTVVEPLAGEAFSASYQAAHPQPAPGGLASLGEEAQRALYLNTVHDRLSAARWPQNTFETIRGTLTQAAAEDWGLEKTKQAIAKLVDPATSQAWIEMVAVTELHGAYSAGLYASAQDQQNERPDRKIRLEWLATHDDRTRPAHRAADGQTTSIGVPFVVGGEPLRFPGDPYASPGNTINCRCSMAVKAVSPVTASGVVRMADTSLPWAPRDTAWDGGAAESAALKWADGNPAKMKQVYLVGPLPGANPATAAAYKFPVVDVSTGSPRLVFRAIAQAAARLGRANLTPAQTTSVKRQIATLYAKADKALGKASAPITNPLTAALHPLYTALTAAAHFADTSVPGEWEGPLAPLGKPSADGRILEPPPDGQLRYRDLPLPIEFQDMTAPGHDGAVAVGVIDGLEIRDGIVWGHGRWDLEDPRAFNIARKVAKGFLGWISLDIDDAAVEGQPDGNESFQDWRITGATLVTQPAFASGAKITARTEGASAMSTPPALGTATSAPSGNPGFNPAVGPADEVPDNDADDLPVAPTGTAWNEATAAKNVADYLTANPGVTAGEAYLDQDGKTLPVADVVGGQLMLIPAAVTAQQKKILSSGGDPARLGIKPEQLADILEQLADALDKVNGDTDSDDDQTQDDDAPGWDGGDSMMELVASGALATRAPLSAFANPQLCGETPVTVTEDRRVYGHVATWRQHDGTPTCHTGSPSGQCITVPHSRTDYSYFHLGSYMTAEGKEISVGTLTADTDHAVDEMNYVNTASHYANTGKAVAVVRVGEDQFGIWFAGTLLDTATEGQITTLRRAPLSGDWRTIGGNLEMVAALAVNTPGFVVPRARITDGKVFSLTAAGALMPDSDDAWMDELSDRVAAKMDHLTQTRADATRRTARSAALATRAHDLAQSLRIARAAQLAARARTPRTPAKASASSAGDDDTHAGEFYRWAVLQGWGNELDSEFNWVQDVGGLPPVIKKVSDHLVTKGMDRSRAIATAVNVVKRWCASPDGLNFPGMQKVTGVTRAKGCAAVADWEAKKARAHADNKS